MPRLSRFRHAVRPRLPSLIGFAALAIVAVGIVWIVVTGLLARARLESVRSEIGRLRAAVVAGDLPTAQRLGERIAEQAASAHALTGGPAWWVAANIPVLGSPLQTARTIAGAADQVGSGALPGVLRLVDEVSHARTGSRIDLTKLAAATPGLDRAAAATTRATAQVEESDGSWLGPVSSARTSLLGKLRSLDGDLRGADRALRLVVPMLGADRPQRYFIGFLNEAESRGLGGIPGAFAIATADHGSVHFQQFGTDADLKHVRAQVDLGPDFDARYGGSDPTGILANSDLSPDFRYAATIWADLWFQKTGQRIDGALAIDPTALGYLLDVTGPARLKDGSEVSAGNVVALTEQQQYTRFPGTSLKENAQRKAYLVAIARAVSSRLTSGGSPHALAHALVRAAAERRLVVWSADARREASIVHAGWGGALPDRAGSPVTGFVVNNAAGDKLDFYLDRAMSYVRTDCGAGATATATLRLTNAAPASGLPGYVTARADQPPPGARLGDNALLVTYYATPGAMITGVAVDGKPVTVATPPERGLPTATVTLELPRAQVRTMTVTIREPRATGPVQVLEQPLVRPAHVSVRAPTC